MDGESRLGPLNEPHDNIEAGPEPLVVDKEQSGSLVTDVEQGADVTNIINELEHAQNNNTDDLVMIDEDPAHVEDGSTANINQDTRDAVENTSMLEPQSTVPNVDT